jgi:hypothetical protein
MLAECVQPICRKTLRHDSPHLGSDPAHLSARLRELALKTYRALRTRRDVRGGDDVTSSEAGASTFSRHDWLDLHHQLVQLERAFDAQRLDSLAAYVASLREQVEDRVV